MRKSKRISAFVLAAVLACGPTMEAGAAADTPVCDETLYITMDPYGEIKESSVVKSYTPRMEAARLSITARTTELPI